MVRAVIICVVVIATAWSEEGAENIPFVRQISASFVEVTCVHLEFGRIIKKQVNVINRNSIVRITTSGHDADGPVPGGDPPIKYKEKYTYRVIMGSGEETERVIPCGIHFVHDVPEKEADEFAASLRLPGFYEIIAMIDRAPRR